MTTLTAHHGTAADFDTFDTDYSNSGTAAIFFTPDYNLAATYAEDIWGTGDGEGRVITVSIDMTSAVELDGMDEYGDPMSLADLMDAAADTGSPVVWLPDTNGDYSPRSEIAVFDTSVIAY